MMQLCLWIEYETFFLSGKPVISFFSNFSFTYYLYNLLNFNIFYAYDKFFVRFAANQIKRGVALLRALLSHRSGVAFIVISICFIKCYLSEALLSHTQQWI